MNWLDYKKANGMTVSPFDADNAYVPAEVMPDYDPQLGALRDTSIQAPEMMPTGQIPGVDEPPAPAPAAPSPKEQPLLSSDDLRRLLQPKRKAPNPALAEAFQRDKEAQQHEDLSNALLMAVTRGKAGPPRNLGHPELSFAASQQPKEGDELSRAMQVAQLKKLLEPDPLKALTGQHLDLENQTLLKNLTTPKVEKPMGHPLTPERRAFYEQQLGHALPDDATEEDVKMNTAIDNPAAGRDVTVTQAAIARAEARRKADAEAAQKASDEERAAHIPGLQHSAGVKLGPADIEDQRTAEAEGREIQKNLQTVIGIVKKKGLDFDPTDPDKAKLEGALTDVQMKLKSKANYGLGVLSGPDQALLDKVTGTPTTIGLKTILGGPESAVERLQGVLDRSNSQLTSKRTVRGYSPIQASGGVSTGAPKVTPGGKPYAKKMYDPPSGKTYYADENGNGIEVVDGKR